MQENGLQRAIFFLESWLAYRAEHVNHVGFSVAVYKDEQVIFSRAYGHTDTEAGKALTTNHSFNMASQTKMLTAALIMHLAEERKIILDEPAVTYLPWLKRHPDRRFQRIKVRHLLAHSSGIRREAPRADYWGFTQEFPTKKDHIRSVLSQNLGFFPGRKVKYSNLGYSLLGLVIESVTGQPYRSYLNQVLALLNLNLKPHTLAGKDVVTGYGWPYRHQRLPIHHMEHDPRAMASVTGVYTTPETMCRLIATLFMHENDLLSKKSKETMWQTQSQVKQGYDLGVEFGYGHEIHHISSRRIVGHSGHAGGHMTATFYDPERHLAVSVAANARDLPSDSVARGIFDAILFYLPKSDVDSKKIPLDTLKFEGRFINELSTIQVVQGVNKLVMIDPDDWESFSWCEELEVIDDKTLRFVTKGSLYNEGELVEYMYSNNKLTCIRLAGQTLLPEATFNVVLSKNLARGVNRG
jgi:CubicO group peptidase (beta-lactamase class C family)